MKIKVIKKSRNFADFQYEKIAKKMARNKLYEFFSSKTVLNKFCKFLNTAIFQIQNYRKIQERLVGTPYNQVQLCPSLKLGSPERSN